MSSLEKHLLTQQEQNLLLGDWNATQVAYTDTEEQCIHKLFEMQVQRTPDAIALVFEGQHLTYVQLNQRANQLAHHLQTVGVGPEVLVGICMERSFELVIALLGVLKAGGAYVPLDPGYPQERLAFLLQNTQVQLLLVQEQVCKVLPDFQGSLISLDTRWQQFEQKSPQNPSGGAQLDDLAYVIYTSGSTGKPKGVMVSHRAIGNRLLWGRQAIGLTTSDRVVQVASFSFDISLWEIFAPLQSGACVVLAHPQGYQDSNYLLTLLVQQQITIAHFVPTMFQIVLDARGLARCGNLRQVLYGGEASPSDVPERFFAQSQAHLQQFYGPTEAAINATSWTGDPQKPDEHASLGHPIANMQVYLLDEEGQPVSSGSVGEIYLGGMGLARGYLGNPDLSAERFVPHPFSQRKGERLYKTGDLARYRPDGQLEFVGRYDQQVKLRGVRIELGEIEAVLRNDLAVREAVVLMHEEPSGDKYLVAYLILQPLHKKEEAWTSIRDHIRTYLPPVMQPNAFVFLESLPLLPNGKVDRLAMPALTAKYPIERYTEEEIHPPRTQMEVLLADIWGEVLGSERRSIFDNFFESGGHSLLATQFIARVFVEFGIELSLLDFFEGPTIAELAELVEQKKGLLLGQVADEELTQALTMLEALSEDEIKALLF
jgi:amino acid adenylation domain-containing protein